MGGGACIFLHSVRRALNDLVTKTKGLSSGKEMVFYRIKVKSGVLDGYKFNCTVLQVCAAKSNNIFGNAKTGLSTQAVI